MASVNINTKVALSDGARIPVIGFGVWASPNEVTTKSCLEALKVGYRHIDGAQMYGNESEVGVAVKESGIPRSELFLTSKIYYPGEDAEDTYAKVRDSVTKLAGDGPDGYVDLFLVHHPESGAAGVKLMWQALERLQSEGYTKSIGVSNFGIGHIESLKAYAKVWPPPVNQIELHPWLQQREINEYCKANNIVIEAYCPIARNKKSDDPTLNEIAKKYSKSTVQVLLRYAVQKKWIPLPKSDTPQRILSNAEIFDFVLDDGDMAQLDARPQEPALVEAVNNDEKW